VNLLVIAPHPDDEAIGCGGAISLHIDRGDRVGVAFLTSGELGMADQPAPQSCAVREAEAENAAQVLGLSWIEFLRLPDQGLARQSAAASAALAPFIARHRPDVILLPHPEDQHPDHQASLPIARAALAATGVSAELRGYEVWTPLSCWHYVEDITAVMPRKLQAIACYRSQLLQFRYDRAAAGLNQYRGALAARSDYAEVMTWLDHNPV
jgi:N-acetylglucosamine malate deacetylase 1